MPPGTGDAQLSLVQATHVHGALIVTTPQQVAVGDALRGVKMFERVGVPVLGIVENMSYLENPETGQADRRVRLAAAGRRSPTRSACRCSARSRSTRASWRAETRAARSSSPSRTSAAARALTTIADRTSSRSRRTDGASRGAHSRARRA